MFKALVVNDSQSRSIEAKLEEVNITQLPEGDVLVKIDYSTLNYKDALAITNSSPIIKKFPMIPGIDFSGVVEETSNKRFKIGDKVLLNGFGVGEVHWGGMSQKARVKSEWLIKLPEKISLKQAMGIGTAGYTAMLCVMALERNKITPDKGEILVTGATGGVGSIAISLLNKLGYRVCASTGKSEYNEYLKLLGAVRCLDRNELSGKGKPLEKEIWAGVIDTLGSYTLVNSCASTKYGGTIAACGLAQGFDFSATVLPFILRGINLAGIDSVYCPLEYRIEAWERLTIDLDLKHLEKIISVITLDQVVARADQMLSGHLHGRIIVDVKS